MGDIVPYRGDRSQHVGKGGLPAKQHSRVGHRRLLSYALPALKEDSLGVKTREHRRYVPANAYDKTSCTMRPPSPYEEFHVRALLSQVPAVQDTLDATFEHVQKKLVDEIRKSKPSLSKDEAITVANAVMHGRTSNGRDSMDTVFGDLFRLLLGRTVRGGQRLKQDTAVSDVLNRMATSQQFRMLSEMCKDNPVTSAMVACLLLRGGNAETPDGNVASPEGGIGDALAKSFAKHHQEDEQNQDSQDGQGEGQGQGQQGKDQQKGKSKKGSGGQSPQQQDVDNATDQAMGNMRVSPNKQGDQKDVNDVASRMAGSEFVKNAYSVEQITVANDLINAYYDGRNRFTASGRYGSREQFERAASMMGRCRGIMRDAISVSRIGDGELIDISTGGMIEAIVPGELAQLAVPELEDIFYKRLADGEVLQQERRGLGDMGYGPLAVLIDVSRSMATGTVFAGMRVHLIDIVNAFGLALAAQATDMSRDLIIGPFNHGLVTDYTAVMPFGRVDEAHARLALQKACGCHPNGGTSFSCALRDMANLMKRNQDKINIDRMDVFFLTDGHGDGGGKDLRKMLPEGTRVYGLLIAEDGVRDEHMRENEKQNEGFFDVAVCCRSNEMEGGFERFYREVAEKHLYQVE